MRAGFRELSITDEIPDFQNTDDDEGKHQPFGTHILRFHEDLQKHGPLDKVIPESSTRSSTPNDWSRYLFISHLSCKFKPSFFQVRGTLVTGKTTQLKLLQKYILQVEPNAKIRTVSSWPYNDRRPLKWRLDDKLPGVLDERPETVSKTYILIDNGQDTFWDEALWNNFFGDHQQRSTGYRIIVFCTKDHK